MTDTSRIADLRFQVSEKMPINHSDLSCLFDRIEALEAELNKCRKANAVMDNTVAALEAENARFRKALEFYADDYPFGNEARKALGVR